MTKTPDIKPGDVFGQLTMLEEAERQTFPSGQYQRRFLCQCSCGNNTLVLRMYLLNGHTKSCGCALRRDYTGQRIGRYEMLRQTGDRDSAGYGLYVARCIECETERVASSVTIRKAGALPCSCMARAVARGESKGSARYRKGHYGRAVQLCENARRRASEKGLPFDLDRTEIARRLEVARCEVTGLALELLAGEGGHPRAPSLDRTDSTLGYLMSNVRVVCWQYNAAKMEHGERWLVELARAIVDRNPATDV